MIPFPVPKEHTVETIARRIDTVFYVVTQGRDVLQCISYDEDDPPDNMTLRWMRASGSELSGSAFFTEKVLPWTLEHLPKARSDSKVKVFKITSTVTEVDTHDLQVHQIKAALARVSQKDREVLGLTEEHIRGLMENHK